MILIVLLRVAVLKLSVQAQASVLLLVRVKAVAMINTLFSVGWRQAVSFWFACGPLPLLYCMPSCLRFLQAQGHRVSIKDFHPCSFNFEAFDHALAARVGDAIHREGETCRALLEGVPDAYQILPVAQ